MKKIIAILLCIFLSIMCFPMSSFADSQQTDYVQGILVSQTVEYLADGSQIITTVYDTTAYENNGTATAATAVTKSGSKTSIGKDSDGDIMWTLTVHGTFSVVTGSSATCTASSYSYTVPGSGWSLQSGSASKSGNKAIANGTFVKKFLGITTQTQPISVTLTCSINGVLS